ncbi:MAG: glutamyl-tRNA reductase [Haemophilus haemolyticus]|jgi:glutamyl-tRNA reductase|uniref:glutamyl-tRNA reductase n=1 Tax=Haemophilus haemolyticus TaxID=726 RepID=UPI00112B0F31|nr:glutamyl-tRNA reductase [Haemophilus haemolyticus]MBS6000223.1 glutamyl-tRNA reductase [Haemophilus haemolyticus]TPH04273.1 glutamyl-tRNA reductase [Haemophilus haemolyticus]
MTLLVLGINHKTASVSVREKVAFSNEKRELALQQIYRQNLAEGAVILSTCNRTEVYFHHRQISPQECEKWLHNAAQWFADIHQLSLAELNPSIYTYQNQQAANHLMRVACGLDSLILGEPQILGQVKQAFQITEDYYQSANLPLSTELSRLFQKTFSTAKRVRTETNIGESAVSVAYAACSLARQIFESLRNLNILLVGAGETIELVSRHLLRHGVKKLMIANRTRERAVQLVEKLATETQIDVFGLDELQYALHQADIVISSTGSPNVLITQDMVKQSQEVRHYAPMLLVDIAVPRDIDETVAELDSVYHYTVDNLQDIIQRNLNQRELASEQAQEIISQECHDFFEWLKVHQFSNLIKYYRQDAERIRQELLEKAQLSLQNGELAEDILQELSYKLMNKLIHVPTQTMQAMMKSSNAEGLHAFSNALHLDHPLNEK